MDRLLSAHPVGEHMIHLVVEDTSTDGGTRRGVEVVVIGHNEEDARRNRDALLRFIKSGHAHDEDGEVAVLKQVVSVKG